MPRSRMILPCFLVILFGSTCARARAQGTPAQPAPRTNRTAQPDGAKVQKQPTNDPVKMKWLLEQWEKQSAKLTSLRVGIRRVDKDPNWQDEIHYQGAAMFKAPNLAYLDFSKIKMKADEKGQLKPVLDKAGKPVTSRYETIVCGKNEVWHYRFESKQIFIFPLAKGERARALDEGPLPFLFNMKAGEAERRYEMLYQAEYPTYYSIKVYPRLQEDKETFKVAIIHLDKEYLLPRRIMYLTPDGRSTRDFELKVVDANKDELVADTFFKGGIFKGWKVENPAAQIPQQGQAGGQPGAAGRAVPR